MNYQILRLNLAGYQDLGFSTVEKTFLEEKLPVKVILGPGDLSSLPLILITNTHSDLKKVPLKLLKQTKLVIHPNSGFDNFSPKFVLESAFPIVIGNPIRAQAVSEYILSALFHRFTFLPSHKKWDRTYNRKLLGEQKILLLGLGHIGEIVKATLNAMGIKVFVYDPFKKKSLLPKEKMSVVIITSSLNPTTKNMINKKFINTYLTPDFTLINPARGEIIDEKALINHLQNHPNSFAYLDVFKDEPRDFSKIKLKNVNLTSHIAGVFNDINDKILDFEHRVLYDFIYNRKTFLKDYRELLLKNRYHKKTNSLI